jgi:DNA-binding NarL/FixJ family response regulator
VPDCRILLADDFEDFRQFVSVTLQQRAGFQVISQAADGLQAVQQAAELRPDLTLLDIGLPKLNGIEAGRRIRQVSPNSKILFLSQESSPDVVEEALAVGAQGYLWKSDAARELLLAVDAVLQGKQFISRRLRVNLSSTMQAEQLPDPAHLKKPSPQGPREGPASRVHEVVFYQDEASFSDGFTHYIEAALRMGNPVIVVASESHRRSLRQRLLSRGWDVATAIRDGVYISLDASHTLSTFMVNDWPDTTKLSKIADRLITQAAKAARGEHPRVAVCGECAPTLLAEGKVDAAIEVERLWDDIVRIYGLDLLCGYVLSDFQREENSHILERICAEHSAVHFP